MIASRLQDPTTNLPTGKDRVVMTKGIKRFIGVFLAFALVCTLFVPGYVPVRAAANTAAYAVGSIITFGSYPQTKVTDASLIAQLNLQTLSADNTVDWGGERYKRVYFTQYTPAYYSIEMPNGASYQDDNGYYINTVYWFKFEPVQWRVLSDSNGQLMVLSEKLLDSRSFNNSASSTWGVCALRTWLNDSFYNTVFSPDEKAQINTSTGVTTGSSTTNDKLFLLSSNEALTPAYGFSANRSTADTARRAQGSDYAKSRGLYVYASTPYAGRSPWWLRTPLYLPDYSGIVNDYNGVIFMTDYPATTCHGIRPAAILTPVNVDGLSIGRESLTMVASEQYRLTAAVTPGNALNQKVNFTSSAPGIAAVDTLGNITASGIGTAVITATSAQGGFIRECHVTVEGSQLQTVEGTTLRINRTSGLITGIDTGDCTADHIKEQFTNTNIEVFNTSGNPLPGGSAVGTGTLIRLMYKDGTEVDAKTFVVFGDVNSDSNIDTGDAGIITDYENFLITWDPVTDSAFLRAADLNADGNIDTADAALIVDVENFLLTVDQSTGLTLPA